MNLPLSLRLALRELTGGSLAIVLLSLFVAVVATTATYATGARLGSAVLGQAGEFLAADLVYEGPDRPPETWAVRAERLGLRHAATVEFPSMAYVGDDVEMLVSAKAVSSSYPLRGQLQAARTATAIESAASSGVELSPQAPPASGEIWLDERLFQALGLGVGDTMGLADADFRAARILVREPDRASSFGALVPRALMSMDDLQATGAVLPGSRVQWRFLLAGNAEALQSFQDSVPEAEERGYRAISPSSREGSSGEAIRETLSYIRLAGTMVLLLALLAGTLAGHRYFAGQRAQVALLKTLGIPGRRLSFLYLAMLCWGCALAVLAGVALGWGLQQWFGYFLESEFGTPTDAPPVAVFVLSAAAALAGFAAALAPALLAAARTAPMRLLRTTDEGRVGWSGVLLPAVVMGAVLFGAAGWRQGLLLLALLAVLAVAAAMLAWLLARLPRTVAGEEGRGRQPAAELGARQLAPPPPRQHPANFCVGGGVLSLRQHVRSTRQSVRGLGANSGTGIAQLLRQQHQRKQSAQSARWIARARGRGRRFLAFGARALVARRARRRRRAGGARQVGQPELGRGLAGQQ